MLFAVPQMILCLAVAWLWLYAYFLGVPKRGYKSVVDDEKERSDRAQDAAVARVIAEKHAELGALSFHETMVLLVFTAALALWFFLSPGFMTGWGDRLENENVIGTPTSVDDATPVRYLCPRWPMRSALIAGHYGGRGPLRLAVQAILLQRLPLQGENRGSTAVVELENGSAQSMLNNAGQIYSFN